MPVTSYAECPMGQGMQQKSAMIILISWERNMRSRCIANLSDFVKDNISCRTMARDDQFSRNLNSDTDSLLDQIQATDFFCSESDNAHLPSEAHEDQFMLGSI